MSRNQHTRIPIWAVVTVLVGLGLGSVISPLHASPLARQTQSTDALDVAWTVVDTTVPSQRHLQFVQPLANGDAWVGETFLASNLDATTRLSLFSSTGERLSAIEAGTPENVHWAQFAPESFGAV